MSGGRGFLAIWSDVSDADLTDYLHWLTREHTQERVGIEGFEGVRVFRARLPGVNRFFILYRLADASVMASPGYLERLNAPTPWSRRIMPILGNFARGGGTVTAAAGSGRGAIIAPVLLDGDAIARWRARLADLTACDGVVAARVMEVDQGGTGIRTNERALRSDDRSFAGLLLVEAVDSTMLSAAIGTIGAAAQKAAIYDEVFALEKQDVAPGMPGD